jgi:hypothetical protein
VRPSGQVFPVNRIVQKSRRVSHVDLKYHAGPTCLDGCRTGLHAGEG